MIVTTARYVVSRTTAGGIAVREAAADGGRLLGYTVPAASCWVATVRYGVSWASQAEPTPEAAEKALRAELRMPETSSFCLICEEELGGPWCDGTHPELTVIDSDLVDVTFGGAR